MPKGKRRRPGANPRPFRTWRPKSAGQQANHVHHSHYISAGRLIGKGLIPEGKPNTAHTTPKPKKPGYCGRLSGYMHKEQDYNGISHLQHSLLSEHREESGFSRSAPAGSNALGAKRVRHMVQACCEGTRIPHPL